MKGLIIKFNRGDLVYCPTSNELAIYHNINRLKRNNVMCYIKKHQRVNFSVDAIILISKNEF